MDKERAVLTVTGKDTVGILAAASAKCAEAHANVIEMTQAVKVGFFTMMMIIEVNGMTQTLDELQGAIQEALPTMDVHVMHENIFEAMHRI
jgi:ACT domain-containing protein